MSDRFTTPFGPRATADEILNGVRLRGTRMIVTGGTSGIGAETVRALARAGAEVTAAVRDPTAASSLIRASVEENWPGSVRAARLDLADLDSVRAFTQAWDGPVDTLVANAGIMALPTLQRSRQGWEMQLATNYLGHFALALGLQPALRDAGAGRVVVVSSGAHRNHPFDLDDPQFAHTAYDPWVAYGRSKTADILLAVGISQRWAEDGIVANALMPGWITTNLQRHVDLPTLQAMGGADADGNRIDQPFFKTAAQGAATSALLAASPLVEGVTGRYFEDNQDASSAGEDIDEAVADHAMNPEIAHRLWDYSAAALRS